MRYYYVPSSYKGRRFGSGIRGGALRGLGFLAGGSLKGGFTSIPVVPTQISEIASKLNSCSSANSRNNWTACKHRKTTLQPLGKSKKCHNWRHSNGIGSAAKTGLKYALPIMGAYTGYKTLAGLNALRMGLNDMQGKLGAPISESLHTETYPVLKYPASWLKTFGYGYGGARFRKGSPEAKLSWQD